MLSRNHYCPHSDADRTLCGSWCTPEPVKAVEKGYTLVKIHEVWHFPAEQCRTGLFANYVVKVKTRIGGVAKLVPDCGAETGLHSSLPGTGGHPTGHRQHCQKSRTQGYRQADAEQLLVQIRRACQQTHHRHSQGARPFVQSHLQCHSRYQHSPPLYRRYLGGRLHQRLRECGQRDQNEHLRSGFRQGAMLGSNSTSPSTPFNSKSSTMIPTVSCTSGVLANPALPSGIFWEI